MTASLIQLRYVLYYWKPDLQTWVEVLWCGNTWERVDYWRKAMRQCGLCTAVARAHGTAYRPETVVINGGEPCLKP